VAKATKQMCIFGKAGKDRARLLNLKVKPEGNTKEKSTDQKKRGGLVLSERVGLIPVDTKTLKNRQSETKERRTTTNKNPSSLNEVKDQTEQKEKRTPSAK